MNPWVRSDGVASWQKHLAPFQRFLPYLTKSLPGVASDIADPAKVELGYDKIPVVLVAGTLNTCFHQLKTLLRGIAAPIQLDLSTTDHVRGSPNNAELIRAEVRSSIEEITLDRRPRGDRWTMTRTRSSPPLWGSSRLTSERPPARHAWQRPHPQRVGP